MLNDKWQIPKGFFQHWSTVEVAYLELVLSQAEKFVGELVKAGEQISERGYRILTIDLSVIGGIFIYLVSGQQSPPFAATTIVALLTTITSICFLIAPLWFYNTMVVGSPPKKLIVSDFLISSKVDQNQYKSLLISECYNYQERIELNIKLNESRVGQIKVATLFLIVGLGSSALVGLAYSYFLC